MQIYVVNMLRRPDRRAAMQAQADRLGLRVTFIAAVDARARAPEELRRIAADGPLGEVTPGDIGCFLSHRDVWQRLVASGDRHAVVLEDDAVLADDAATLLGDDGWVPAGERLIKLERYGSPTGRLLVSKHGIDVRGRLLRRLYSKNAGSAAYLISREAAELCLAASRVIDLPVDHLLFNPGNSPVFAALRPALMTPAPVEQDRDLGSDLPRDRRGMERLRHHLRRELVRGYYELRVVPSLLWLVLTGQGELHLPSFGKAPAPRDPV